MMKSKLQIAGMLLLMSVTLNAVSANVEWNRMKSVDAEVWDSGPIWGIWGYSEKNLSVMPVIMVTIDEMTNSLCGSEKMGGDTIWVRQMSQGDLISYETMHSPGLTYFYHKEDETRGTSDYSIPYRESEDPVYLAFSELVWNYEGKEPDRYLVYGWVEVSWGYEPTVLASAWDVDGGAMYVGGGAVPEPTGAMLALVGMALLALRRKRWLRGDFELEVTK